MALLEVKDVRRSFGGLVAVNRVSFSVKPGRIKAVIGPNGAGKTTLFNIISGLLKADAGQVTFKDRSITGFKSYQIARAGISRTFQNPSLFLQMNVLENVMVGRHRRSGRGIRRVLPAPSRPAEGGTLHPRSRPGATGLRRPRPARRVPGRRSLFRAAPHGGTGPRAGHRSRIAAARRTCQRTEHPEKENLGALIRRIRDRGITVLLVEHDMTLVMDLSDDILVLHDGTVIAEGSPATIQNDPTVISTYLGGEFRPPEEVELALLTGRS